MRKILGIVVLLLLLAAAAVYLGIDAIVKRSIEAGTTYATGVPTRVEAVDVGLFSGRMDVGRLEIANPPGYNSPYFFRLNSLNLALNPRSLLEATVRVPELTIEGARVNLERAGATSNFNAILDNVRRVSADTDKTEEPPPDEGGPDTRFIIDRLRISRVSARAILARELGESGTLEVSVPPLTLENIGADSGGVTLAQLAALITRELLVAVSRQIELPGDLDSELQRRLEQVQDLEGTVREETESRAREAFEQQRDELFDEGRRLLEPR